MSDLNTYADQLNIETPEQVELRFPIAGVGSRFLALLTDTLLQIGAYLVLTLLFILTLADSRAIKSFGAASEPAQKWMVAGFIFVNFVMFWGYFSLFEALWNGQTPGKRLMKIRVIKDSGRSITLFEAMARNLLRIIDMLPPSTYLVGVVSMVCNKQQKRLGDLVAGTIVVHERIDEQPLMTHNSRTFTAALYPQPPVADRFASDVLLDPALSMNGLPADAVGRLQMEDLHVIETFFNRALDLSLERRAELAARVAAAMSGKMGVPLPDGIAPERMLELIAYQMRSHARN
jgi:uncharacterized RDD family membrane protein YckC